MKKTCLFLLSFITILTAQAQRTKFNFNSDWKVSVGDAKESATLGFNDAAWKAVTLPYAWNEDDAFRKDIADLRTGIAWYRKHFKLPLSAKGQKIFLEFEGIRQAGEFYVNGTRIGMHENGVMAFGFDVSEAVHFGDAENVIAVRIDNDWNYKEKATDTKFQWQDKNFNANYGGINKNVYLHITPRLYQTLPLYSNLQTTGVYVYADDFNIKDHSAAVHAQSQVRNESGRQQQVIYQVSINDMTGKTVKTFRGQSINVPNGETATVNASSLVNGLKFWSWGYGYLYDIKTSLLVNGKETDVVHTKTGFRKTAFKDGMIYLNDRVMMVHGYAQRTTNEWPAIGNSVPAWLSDYGNGLMLESNANLVRWMHITPWKQDIESCDRLGLLQAMPAGDAEGDVTGTRWEQRKAVMRDAIIYNRNNPSILFYECGNKGIRESNMREMKALKEQYDPNGGRAIGSREMLDSKAAEYGGEMLYTNKSGTLPFWAMEYSRDEGSRKYWDEYTPPYHKDGDGPLHNGQSAKDYNRNMESHAVENVKRWDEFWRERPGTGKRVSSGGVNIGWTESNSHHRGEENYRRSGEVDALRIKKENFYANQVMWDGWVIPEKEGLHIVGHWNYKEGLKKDVYVVSTADRVELKVNGKSLGFGSETDDFLFTFKDVEWKSGSISAVGYNASGKPVCSSEIKTAGEPVALKLTSIKRPTAFLADGHDLMLLQVEVVDATGMRCPTALNMIHYELSGPAEWRGGMAMGPNNYTLTQTFPVEGGINRFFVRSTTTPGNITLKATADGLKEATLTFSSKPFAVKDGLSNILPSDGLLFYLDKGPTPSTPSYKMLRTAVTVNSATAGANADSATRSIDDNERTDWVNDGALATAWIEYTLQHEAVVNEVELKLNNFRSRSYPLRITVDGHEAFNGNTPRSLGYVTLQCKPQKGTKVRIQLVTPAAGAAEEQMVEVSGKKLDDGVTRDDAKAKGTLSIIEAEIYEAVKPKQ